ncbi:MAG: hypothetical protein IT200_07470 [Thermoleophilia bacterium]|nr:hypothetical protein [Thermoleophilia bacterium]
MTGRTAFRVFLVVIAVVAVAFQTLSVAGTLSSETRVITRQEAGVRSIEVHAGMGSVYVTGRPGTGSVAVRQTQRWWVGRPSFSARRAGSVLVVRSSCPVSLGRGCEGRLDITVPPGTAVDIRTDDGAVHLDGLSAAVRVRSGDGVIDAAGLRGADVDLEAGDADVTAVFASAPRRIRASARDAAVRILVPRDGRAWRVEGGTGDATRDVAIAQDPAAARTISADTADGPVRIAYAD